MTVLVVGASGATGSLVVESLLDKGEVVSIIVRSLSNLPRKIIEHDNVVITLASILDMSDAELKSHVRGCRAVVSCLGHNLSFKGLFGHPRRLVTSAVYRLCLAIESVKPCYPIKFILMNTTGNQDVLAGEVVSKSERFVITLIRWLLPPHADNEKAARYLQSSISKDDSLIEWVVVRPDGLVNEDKVSRYDIYPSPVRSAIFDAGKTSRINVADFMVKLISDYHLWDKWKTKMPVIYNAN